MDYISNRDVVVRSKKTGHAIEFKKGVPTAVPKSMVEEVLEKGILPASNEAVEPGKTELVAEKPKIVLPPDDGDVREEQVLAVIKAIVKRNDPKDFTGGGAPSAGAVTAVLGWRADRKDVQKVWEKHKAELVGRGNPA